MTQRITNSQNRYLNRIYSDPRHPASFQGPEAVYRAVRREGTHRITYANIRRWVQNRENYSKNRKIRKQFQRNRVIVAGIDDQWDTDLADLHSFKDDNQGFKYLLCVIDIFSRYAWVKTLKDKTAGSIVNAFRQILAQDQRKPDRLRSDAAKDFTSNRFQDMCKTEKIRHFTTHGEKQANYVERFIQTLKTRIFRFMVGKNTPKYIEVLPDLVFAYNNSYHTGIQEIPAQVNKENEKKLWWQMYLPDGFYRPETLKKPKKTKFRFSIGDFVRISFTASGFNRQYEQKWTTEVFVVLDRFPREGIPIYVLKNTLGEKIQGTFYESEMQAIDYDPTQAFKIELPVLKYKGRRPNRMALVKWIGWPKQYNQWIPEKDIKDLT